MIQTARLWITRLAAVALTIGALTTCSAPQRPNIVLIVIDTLRADHVGCYGYERPTSPHLDALARQGTRFETAYAPSSWTLPSVASILTGLYPAVHGVEHHDSILGGTHRTMAEAYRDAGYVTAAFSANAAFVTPLTGLDRGFQEFRVLRGPIAQGLSIMDTAPGDPLFASMAEVATAGKLSPAAIDWLSHAGHEPRPFFLYLHYFDPHAGYFPPPEYAKAFGVAEDDPLAGRDQWKIWLPTHKTATPEQLPTLAALYDGEIAFTDDSIGRVLDALANAVSSPTIVVVASDHGEEFGDHGSLGHGQTLWQEMLHVPLILSGYKIPSGKVVTNPVSLTGLWSTLAEVTGVGAPPQIAQPSFASLMHTDAEAHPQEIFADLEVVNPNVPQIHRNALIDGPWKLVMTPDREAELFRLTTDPGEREDLARKEPERFRSMRAQLRDRNAIAAASRAQAPPTKIDLTPERRAQLRALGYIE